MRLDRLRPRTWLLAGLAVAAAVGWLLALAGVGARARVLPADPALLQPLPQAPAAAAPRLLPLARYDAAVSRPLFANDRRPHPFVLDASADGGEARGGSSFEYILTSVLIAPPLRLAIVQPKAAAMASACAKARRRMNSPNGDWSSWRRAARSSKAGRPPHAGTAHLRRHRRRTASHARVPRASRRSRVRSRHRRKTRWPRTPPSLRNPGAKPGRGHPPRHRSAPRANAAGSPPVHGPRPETRRVRP